MNIIEFTGEKPYPDGILSWNGELFLSCWEKDIPIAKGDLIIYGTADNGKVKREIVRKDTLTHKWLSSFMKTHTVFPNTEVEKDYPTGKKKKKSLADEMNELAKNSYKDRKAKEKDLILEDIKNCSMYGLTKFSTNIRSEYYSIIDDLIAEDFNVSSYKVASSNLLKVDISWGDIKRKEVQP